MARDRRRFQFAIKDLFEIVLWVALGTVAMKLGLSLTSPLFGSLPHAFLVAFAPGMAIGAAVGVIPQRRARFAVVGFFAWPLMLATGGAYLIGNL